MVEEEVGSVDLVLVEETGADEERLSEMTPGALRERFGCRKKVNTVLLERRKALSR